MSDHIFIKISLYHHVKRFEQKGKLTLHYIGSYEIVEIIGRLAYRLVLPMGMGRIYNVLHASLLSKCLGNQFQVVWFEDVELEDSLVYEER